VTTEPGIILRRASDFTFRRENGRLYFVHASGRRVRTDRLGEVIWEALPAESSELISVLKSAGGRDEQETKNLITDFVSVLGSAGIVEKTNSAAVFAQKRNVENESAAAGGELVSVVVITHNGAAHVRDCFESLTAQSYRNIEIIAIDNGSTDGTPDLIRKEYPQVDVLSLPRNLHFARGVNRGLRRSKGRFIFVLNQDVEVAPDGVAVLAGQLEREAGPRAGAVVPLMKFFQLRGFVNGLGNQIRSRGWGSDNFIGFVDVGQFDGLREVPSACFGAVMLDREAIDDVGLLDEGYSAFYEDADWSFRCRLKGRPIVSEPRAVVYHKFGASYPRAGKLRLAARNRLRLVLKLFHGRALLVFLRNYLREDAKNALSLFLRGKWGSAAAYGAAYLSLALQAPGILVLRKRLARSRRGEMSANDILAMNPLLFSALDENNDPVIDAAIVAGYYRRVMAGVAPADFSSESGSLV
jgi:hypothetical protein